MEVRRGVSVRKVLFENDKAIGVAIQGKPSTDENNNLETIHGTVIVDSTGQRSLIGRQLGLNTIEPNLKKASLFTHFEGGHRDGGIDEGATLILQTEEKPLGFGQFHFPIIAPALVLSVI